MECSLPESRLQKLICLQIRKVNAGHLLSIRLLPNVLSFNSISYLFAVISAKETTCQLHLLYSQSAFLPAVHKFTQETRLKLQQTGSRVEPVFAHFQPPKTHLFTLVPCSISASKIIVNLPVRGLQTSFQHNFTCIVSSLR